MKDLSDANYMFGRIMRLMTVAEAQKREDPRISEIVTNPEINKRVRQEYGITDAGIADYLIKLGEYIKEVLEKTEEKEE